MSELSFRSLQKEAKTLGLKLRKTTWEFEDGTIENHFEVVDSEGGGVVVDTLEQVKRELEWQRAHSDDEDDEAE